MPWSATCHCLMILHIDQSCFDRYVITLRKNQQFLCIREAYLCCPTLVAGDHVLFVFPVMGKVICIPLKHVRVFELGPVCTRSTCRT